jgi:hypothetical protein
LAFEAKVFRNARRALLLPAKLFFDHLNTLRRHGLRDELVRSSLERLEIRSDIIGRSRGQKNEKLNSLIKNFKEVQTSAPKCKDFRFLAVEIIAEAMIKNGSYKEAFLLVGRNIHEKDMRDDIILTLIDKMMTKGLDRQTVIDVCKSVAGQVPVIYKIIDGIYENYPLHKDG